MQKIIHPCDVPEYDGKKYPLFCKIIFEKGELSISGVIGPRSSGNVKGGCGQVCMEFKHRDKSQDDKRTADPISPSALRFASGWTADIWLDFLAVWHDYHLNYMQAGCDHQRALGWDADGYDKHPAEPCPECGYRYGSAWLHKEVPEDVIAFLESLPETDKTPAWV